MGLRIESMVQDTIVLTILRVPAADYYLTICFGVTVEMFVSSLNPKSFWVLVMKP